MCVVMPLECVACGDDAVPPLKAEVLCVWLSWWCEAAVAAAAALVEARLVGSLVPFRWRLLMRLERGSSSESSLCRFMMLVAH